jgi:hypothetical protein
LKKAVRETGAAPTIDGPPVFFRPRYPDLENDKVVLEDGPKGTDSAAVTSGERELESDPEIRTEIPDQRLDELPLDQ